MTARVPLVRFALVALLVALLVAGCASVPARDRFVYVAADSYACGAAEGLGCGLALEPVLRALDRVPGVASSGASWDGLTFRIELLQGADAQAVAEAATGVLEGVTRPIDAARAGDGRGVRWLNAEQTVELSRVEAGVIAADLCADIAAEVVLDPGTRRRLDAIVREVIVRAFERAHAAGGGGHRRGEQLPQARVDFERRTGFLSPEQIAAISSDVDEKLCA
jgi:hypothetical protein